VEPSTKAVRHRPAEHDSSFSERTVVSPDGVTARRNCG
jgi:hypothetical protein